MPKRSSHWADPIISQFFTYLGPQHMPVYREKAEQAKRGLQAMALTGEILERGNTIIVSAKNEGFSPEELRDVSAIRQFAYWRNEQTSLPDMTGKTHKDKAFIPVTCELHEFKALCDLFRVSDFNPEILAAFKKAGIITEPKKIDKPKSDEPDPRIALLLAHRASKSKLDQTP